MSNSVVLFDTPAISNPRINMSVKSTFLLDHNVFSKIIFFPVKHS